MSTRAIRAGRAFVELFTDNKLLIRGLARARARLTRFAGSVKAMGIRMLAFSAAAALPIAFATRTFVAFEDQMKAVQAVTGATGQAFDRLNSQAKELGRTTSYTAAKVAEGMLSLGRAGFKPTEIEAAIPAVLNLARATGTELAEAADIAAGTLRAFGLEAGQTGRVADVLVAAANNSSQTLTDLGEAMKYVAPIARVAGESVESTAQAIGILANMQIKGSMGGTAVRKMLLSLADPAVQKRLSNLGVAALDAAGNIRPVGTVIAELATQLEGKGSGERLGIMKALFGLKAAGAAASMAAADATKLADAIAAADGSAAKTAKTMDSGLGGALRRLMSAFEGIQIAIGEALTGVLGDFVEMVTKASGSVTAWIKANQGLVVGIVAAIAGVAAAGGALIAMGMAASSVVAVFTLVEAVASTLGIIIGGVATALMSWPGLAVAAFAAWALHAGHLKGLLTGVGDTIGWLAGKFGELKDRAAETFGRIADALMSGDMQAAAAIAWLGLKVEWIRGTNWLKQKWWDVTAFMSNVWTEMVFGLAETLTAAWHEMIFWLNAANPLTTEADFDDLAREKAFAMADIEIQRQAAQKANSPDKQIAAANARLKAAEAEKAAAIAAVRATREGLGRGDHKGYKNPRETQAAKDAAAAVASADAVAGTFSAAKVAGLSGGRNTVEEKIAAGVEQVAGHTGRLVEGMREGGLVFG